MNENRRELKVEQASRLLAVERGFAAGDKRDAYPTLEKK